jgi:hypothetical protein
MREKSGGGLKKEFFVAFRYVLIYISQSFPPIALKEISHSSGLPFERKPASAGFLPTGIEK